MGHCAKYRGGFAPLLDSKATEQLSRGPSGYMIQIKGSMGQAQRTQVRRNRTSYFSPLLRHVVSKASIEELRI